MAPAGSRVANRPGPSALSGNRSGRRNTRLARTEARAPAKVAELRFNTYGFNLGGEAPFWKSHPTFFFYNMEWRSLIQGQTLNQTVPLPSTYGFESLQLLLR